MADKYYVIINNKQNGPFPIERIKELLANKQINPKTHIWKKGLKDWVPLGSLSEFKSQNIVSGKPPGLNKSTNSNKSKTKDSTSTDSKKESSEKDRKQNTDDSNVNTTGKTTGDSTFENDKKIWFLFDGNDKKGPLSRRDIIDLLEHKIITGDTPGMKGDMGGKKEISLFEEFKDYKVQESEDKEFEVFDATPEAVVEQKKAAANLISTLIIHLKILLLGPSKIKGVDSNAIKEYLKPYKKYKIRPLFFLSIITGMIAASYYYLIPSKCPSGMTYISRTTDEGYTENFCRRFDKNNNKFIRHGKYELLSKKGDIISFFHYSNGQIEGKYTVWHENGKKKINGFFKRKSNVFSSGKLTEWDKNGNKISDASYYSYDGIDFKLNGTYTGYFNNSKIAVKAEYINNILNGKFIEFYENGNKKELCNYNKKGIAICTGWHPDNKKMFEGTRISISDESNKSITVMDGKWRFWDENGKLLRVVYYNKGKEKRTDLVDYKEISQFSFKDVIQNAIFSPRGNFVKATTPEHIIVSDIENSRKAIKLRDESNQNFASFSPDETYFISKNSNSLRINFLSNKRPAIVKLKGSLNRVLISPDGKFIAIETKTKIFLDNNASTFKHMLNFYSIYKRKIHSKFKIDNEIGFLSFSPDSKYLLIKFRSWKGFDIAKIYAIRSKKTIATFPWDKSKTGLFSKNSKYVMDTHKDGLTIYNLKKRKLMLKIKLPELPAVKAFSPSSKHILFSVFNTIKVYNIRNKKLSAKLELGDRIITAGFSKNNKFIFAASNSSNLIIYDLKNKKIFNEIPIIGKINHAGFTPDSTYLFASSEDESGSISSHIKFFNLKTGSLNEINYAGSVNIINGRRSKYSLILSYKSNLKKNLISSAIYDIHTNRIITSSNAESVKRRYFLGYKNILALDISMSNLSIYKILTKN